MASLKFRQIAPRSGVARALATLAWAMLAGACSARAGDGSVRSEPTAPGAPADAGTASGFGEASVCSADNPFCAAPDASLPIPSCGHEAVDLTPVGVNVMIAIDGSASMMTHWTRIQGAIETLRASHPTSSFGLQLFWGELQENLQSGLSKNNWCGETYNRVLDVGNHPAQELLGFLGVAPPGPAFVGGLFETSPVVEPLNYYLTNATKLADPKRTNYLLFVTDGNDNCFGSVFTNKADKLLAYEKLAIELAKINIRTIPIGFDAASRAGATGRGGSTPANTDLEVLGTLLRHGGSGLSEVPKVDDPSKLADVITQVGQRVRNCRFEVPDTLDPSSGLNPFELGFTVNGRPVERDRLAANGWNFVAGNTSQVELYGPACEAVRAGQLLEARKTCMDDVCGTAAIKVETRPRSVLFLLDSSASRIECEDGTLGCLIPPGVGIERPLSFWEVVEHAVAESLTAPVNDDVAFGLQFFPSKNAAAFSCEVDAAPEIPAAQGNEITIMSKMLEKLPFGFSPVVQVMENVAAAPGALVGPDVLGAVVMLSDGGDNCAGVAQPQIVTRLEAAAKKLLDAGVKTYAIRYGSADGKTPDQEAQLRAIVSSGGTAIVDPANPMRSPYVEAKDAAELTAALASISDKLATCSFALGGLPADADRSKANLYLNGEVIPYDMAHQKRNGWDWTDAAKTSVELYGDSCTAFKTNRRTSVVVELGCAPVVLL